MPAIVVVGAQWGDDGKGKIVDLLAEKVNLVVRYSGGDNAGHTVINELGEFRLHLIPSGIFYPHTACIIANGTVINPAVLIGEIDDLDERGVDISRLFISDRANLIMPYHTLFDGLEEDALGGKAVGTTRKGIGPAFSDKIARIGIRTGDLLDKEIFFNRLRALIERKNIILAKVYNVKPLVLDDVYKQYLSYGERLAPYIKDTSAVLNDALDKGQIALMEGAQGTLLDPDFGTYPYTTSSSPLAGGACLGAGISPTRIKSVIAVFKAYCTRVGGGPFPTELNNETGQAIREKGHEYGTTTGRPRRCGWFDAVAARFSTRLNGYTGAAITRLDVLDEFEKLKICVAYKLEGKQISYVPGVVEVLQKCEPVYEELPGWQTQTGNVREYYKLPANARKYIERLEQLCGCPVNIVSVGARRDQTVIKKAVL